MSESFFLVSGLALILFFQKPSPAHAFGRLENPRRLAEEAFEIFWQSSAVLLLWIFILQIPVFSPHAPAFSLWAAAAIAYFINQFRRKTLFVPVAAICFWILLEPSFVPFWPAVLRRAALFSGFLFFLRMGLAALRHRLLFCRVPPLIEGSPIVLSGFALFLLALSGIWSALGY